MTEQDAWEYSKITVQLSLAPIANGTRILSIGLRNEEAEPRIEAATVVNEEELLTALRTALASFKAEMPARQIELERQRTLKAKPTPKPTPKPLVKQATKPTSKTPVKDAPAKPEVKAEAPPIESIPQLDLFSLTIPVEAPSEAIPNAATVPANSESEAE